VPVIVYPHVVSRLRFATVGEDRRAAGLLALPCPRVALNGQFIRADGAAVVEGVCAVCLARRVIADDLGITHTHVTDAAIGGVEHEYLTRHPFTPIAGQDRAGRRVRARDGLPFVDPLADKHLQAFVLASWLGGPLPWLSCGGRVRHGFLLLSDTAW
jgi:hypothetical protein